MAREKTFRFKQFAVINDLTAMKVGTDGVLLGAWCPVNGARHVLDVGTGCGVIALMIAQRNDDAIIHAIDIDQDAIEEAALNFAKSSWSERLTARKVDFNQLKSAEGQYDLIVSNPPFFTDSLLASDKSRTLARHTLSLSYRQLIEGASRLLTDYGSLSMISPVNAEKDIIEVSAFASLPVKRLTRVFPVEGGSAKRILWLLSRCDIGYQENTLTIAHSDNTFTKEYINLTRAFYLKM